jgi:alkylation response protein AidB-like acyl-CoA dehydrogenase
VDFSLNEEQLMLKSLVERLVEERYAAGMRAGYRAAEAGYSSANWAQLAELGLLAVAFTPAQGGLAGGLVEIMVLMEALGRAQVVEPVLEQVILPGRLLAQSASDETELMQRMMSGEAHVALAHFEHAAGFELEEVATHASCDATPLLHGEKTVVLGGFDAQCFLVSARSRGQGGSQQLGFYVVDRAAPGLEVVPLRIADGSWAVKLRLQGAPARSRLAVNAAGLHRAADDARVAAGAEMLGIMSSLFEATLNHVRTRKQFGAPLGNFQVIQHRMADLYVLLEQSRSQLYRAALSGAEGVAEPAAVAAMKSYLSAAAVEMGEQCIHLHGGMGITDELLIGHGHKRLLVLATLLGDAEHELDRFAGLATATPAMRESPVAVNVAEAAL